jgi:hypothetical protein
MTITIATTTPTTTTIFFLDGAGPRVERPGHPNDGHVHSFQPSFLPIFLPWFLPSFLEPVLSLCLPS